MRHLFKLLVIVPCVFLNAYAVKPAIKLLAPTLTATGLQGITKDTPFDVAKIQSLFPHDEVQLAKSVSEGMEYNVMLVARNNATLFTLLPTNEKTSPQHVLCLAYNSNKITNSLGVKIGDGYQSIYSGNKAPSCISGTEEMSGQTICPAPNSNSIYYVFQGKWDGVDGVIPPQAVLNQWTVKEIIWLSDVKMKDVLSQYCRTVTAAPTKAEVKERAKPQAI